MIVGQFYNNAMRARSGYLKNKAIGQKQKTTMIRSFTRKVAPVAAFFLGYTTFPKNWTKGYTDKPKIEHVNSSVVDELESTQQYKSIAENKDMKRLFSRNMFPNQHLNNYVVTGLLHGKDLKEIDPIIFRNEKKGELIGFFFLGKQLLGNDGGSHRGIISLLLDENLCMCGFPFLPSKMGVTANLSIDFKNPAPPSVVLVLRAHLVEHKGRKAVIKGNLETFPLLKSEKKTEIAEATCVMVEPRWFKYLSWLNLTP